MALTHSGPQTNGSLEEMTEHESEEQMHLLTALSKGGLGPTSRRGSGRDLDTHYPKNTRASSPP